MSQTVPGYYGDDHLNIVFDDLPQGPRVQVEDPDPAVVTAGDDVLPVGTECETAHALAVAGLGRQEPARGHVLEAAAAVVRGGQHILRRGEQHFCDGRCVAVVCHDVFAGRGVE